MTDRKDKEEINMHYIDEESLKPLTSSLLEATKPRSLSMLEADNTNNRRPSSGEEIEDLEPSTRPPIGFDTRGIDDSLPIVPTRTIPDVNIYQHKKTLAQGMMDLALLSANANQLRYVLQTDGGHPYYYPSLTLIGASLLLQIAVGIGLIWNSRYNVNYDNQMCQAERANNWTVIGIFLVTIFNVFISSFGVVDTVSVISAPVTTV